MAERGERGAGWARRHMLQLSGAAALMPWQATGAVRKMSTRPIPSSGEPLPMVGVGTYRTFDVGSSGPLRASVKEVLRRLFEAGGSMIDSSPMYGTAEAVTGDMLAELGMRDKAFIATKVWTEGRRQGAAQMRASMEKLRTDKIDLMQVHNLVDWRTQFNTMRGWQDDGKFRYLGITHYTPGAFGRLMEVMAREKLDFLQIPYSIIVREAEDRILSFAADKGVGVIVNRPFEGGGLFGKVRGRDLPAWAAEFDCGSWAQFFLKYLLGHPAVTCVIPGTGKIDHLVDNVGAAYGRLPDGATRARMAALVDGL
jgi:diketogulonate reductase-like aldo/keto reductase